MREVVDYFSNHSKKLRFPWKLYHRPIVRELAAAVRARPGPHLLNVGSGPFFELSELDVPDRRFTICDIDPRAIELACRLHGDRLARADVIEAGAPLPYPADAFDVVASLDVVEHVPDPLPWLRDLVRVLKPGGLLLLSTPNYASHSLRALEATVLEMIARLQGFSRRGLHPSKMDAARLLRLLGAAGATRPEVREISFGWVLAARASK